MFEGDIYYKSSVTSKALRLTTTDLEQNVVNGLSDWTYEGRKYSSTLDHRVKNLQADNNNHEQQVYALSLI